MKKIAIIGAGPAGIFSAILLENFPGEIHIFEQNSDVGEKLKTTGGGRMNVTNKVFSDQEFSSSSINLYKRIFKNPHVKNREEIFKKLDIQYSWEKNRAILKSEDAIGEVYRLRQMIKKQSNTELHLNTKIEAIVPEQNGLNIKFNKNEEFFDYVIIASGGMYRMKDLGPEETIYNLPISLGHSITALSPSLCPLIFNDPRLKKYSGIAFEGKLNDKSNNKSVHNDIIITHFGLSGPACLDFSAISESKNITLSFIAKISEKEFINQFNQMRNGKNSIKKFLKQHLSQRLAEFHLENSDIGEDFMADIPKLKLKKLTESIFHYPLPQTQTNTYPSSWTTKGGVALNEIHTHTLESKKQPNVFLAGEILDINGLCGGYNISFAAISAQIITDAINQRSKS